jgi:prohibitin 1
MAANVLGSIAKVSVGLGVLGWGMQEALYNVDGGERAVIFDRFRGVLDDIKGEGTHIRIPLIQYPTVYNIRTRPRILSSLTGTKDLQMVNISLRVLSHPQPEKLPEIYKTLGVDFDERVLPSIGNEVLKAVVAQYNADQLLTQREKVSRQILDELTERATEFNLVLDDVSITHLTFGQEFTLAIESKQVQQQRAERAKFVVMKAEQEKKAAIIRAEGESEAATLISDSLQMGGTGLIEVRRIDTAKEIAQTLAHSRGVTYVPGANNMLLNMPPQ